ncbi:MAG: tetratricopeptide repeat protein [Trichocoleus desertorum ATA4-8-CV12]|jgi:tetratricopeptide (TPR) repeat protein|nr:tetratricopeptide repeat protein [Trichocoleus desertorum ATA4-8-CV12]
MVRNRLISGLVISSSLWLAASVVAAPSASEYRQLGLTYRAQARYAEAIAAFQQAVELEPNNLSGRITLGWTQHLAGQELAAMESLFQGLYRDPNSVPALNALGIVYLVQGDLSSAVITHSWAAWLEPNNEIPYYNLSLAAHRLREYGWASLAARRAAALEPNNPHPWVALAIIHWGGGDREAAIQAYEQALALNGSYSDRAFLPELKTAGFSAEQIQQVEQILAATVSR